MPSHRLVLVCSLLAVSSFSSSCDSPRDPADGALEGGVDARDGGRDSSDGGAIGDGADGNDLRPDVEAEAGPLTLVVTDVFLDLSRTCDFDGDGSLDNCIADLGSPAADLLAAGLAAGLQGRIAEGFRNVVHFPWVDDTVGPNDPETVAIFFRGKDTDDPAILEDDFSGDEPFWVAAPYLDACGEPRTHFAGVSLEGGVLTSGDERGALPILDSVFVYGARASAEIEGRGISWSMRVCGYAPISELGSSVELASGVSEDLSVLEVFVSGGEALGYPTVPGVTPDVDVDGDGLERIRSNSEGHITSCIDGDLTEIVGRDCWQDERMADGFSMNLILEGTSASFAGREPGWEDFVSGECPDGPPEPSLWDPT